LISMRACQPSFLGMFRLSRIWSDNCFAPNWELVIGPHSRLTSHQSSGLAHHKRAVADSRTGPGKHFLGHPSLEFKPKSSAVIATGDVCDRWSATRITKGNAARATAKSSERGRHDSGRYRHRSINYRPRRHERRGKRVAPAALRFGRRCSDDHE